MTGAAAASYEWAVSLDGEEWSVIDSETDETFDVTADLVGMYVKVTVTAEDGETASDVTTEPVAEEGALEIESAEATKVNVIEVTMKYTVDPLDAEVTLTKGTSTIPATVEWDDSYKVATVTSASKLSNGVYTVTVASEENPLIADTADVEIVDQYVKEIVITNDIALTNADKDEAYAHYDVYDQYGESLRSSTSITWAGSCIVTPDKTTGTLKLEKHAENDDWVYNEQIYVTGVYTKTGVSVTKTLTVGTEQSLDTLDIAGFVKKGTSTIVQTLPKDFKEGTYYLLFKPLDQNGTQMRTDNLGANAVTFVSDNVLVVKDVSTQLDEMTVEGETYAAALVSPGIKVSDGGAVTITAIANKTGNKTEISMNVGEDQVVASFVMSAPSRVVADGDVDVEIPFVAKDPEGNEITDFVTLAKQTTFNTLSFNASDGSTLRLAEQDDGSAKLLWSDTAAPEWGDSRTTDGVDRPISLTAIVVGGETDNEMLYVSDMRRPDGILSVDMNSVYTENSEITFYASDNDGDDDTAPVTSLFESFQFVDQYGETIEGTKETEKKFGDSTGFFAATLDGETLQGIDFAGYTFGVRVKYAGSEEINYNGKAGAHVYLNADGDGLDDDQAVITGTGSVTFKTEDDVPSAATGEGFKFEIAKLKLAGKTTAQKVASAWEASSPSKYFSCAVVDLSQLKNLTVNDLNKFYIGETAYTGKGRIKNPAVNLTTLKSDAGLKLGTAAIPENYTQEVKVTGDYNGSTVTVPAEYYEVEGKKLQTAGGMGENEIVATINNGINIQDLYDAKTDAGNSKDASDNLTITLRNVNATVDHATDEIATEITYKALSGDTVETTDAKWATVPAATAVIVTEKKIAKGTLVTEATTILNNANTALAGLDADDLTRLGTDPGAATTADIVEAVNAIQNDVNTLLTDAGTNIGTFDVLTAKVTLSDQAPSATSIEGLEETYTINPEATQLLTGVIPEKIGVTSDPVKVKVKDQYGVDIDTAITYTANNIEEDPDAYAENNFKTSGNAGEDLTIQGAERGDTFTLTLKAGGASASTQITIGADANANITGSDNNYLDNLIGNGRNDNLLEQQRKEGLGIPIV